MSHRLDPLLRPTSVAVVGASSRPDSLGRWALTNLAKGGYRGTVYAVNPRYSALDGKPCFASLDALPETPQLVIFAVGDSRIEAALDEAIATGVPAAVVMSTLYLDDDDMPPLRERLRQKIDAAGMLVCGANGMGFYNVRDRVWACGFDSASHTHSGNVAIISQSGAGMSGIIDCEQRLPVNVAVSTGNELSVCLEDYLDFVLELPETHAVGLFMETSRKPQALLQGFAKAAARGIPIVVLKVGRTQAAAELTVSHSGALAGNDAAFAAVFDRYGVLRVSDQDAWVTTLILLAASYPVAERVSDGGLVTLHDSGGERQLLIDLADEVGVPLTQLQPETEAALRDVLDPELLAVNPLDGWSRGGSNAADVMAKAFAILMNDPQAALGAVVHDRAPYGKVYPAYVDYLRHSATEKPLALVAACQGSGSDELAVAATLEGLPVLDGVRSFLVAAKALFAYRDSQRRLSADLKPSAAEEALAAKWGRRLQGQLSEAQSLALLQDFGIETARTVSANSVASAISAASELGYPVVLKTACPDVAHKSDVGGVHLGLRDDDELAVAYAEVSKSLGSDVLVCEMLPAGVELLLGARIDAQFGPIVIIGFGGIFAEAVRDTVVATAPFDAAEAWRLLNRLQLRRLLDGLRGAQGVDMDALSSAIARFSMMAYCLRDVVAEIDVNPLLASADNIAAADALVIARGHCAET